MRRILNIVLLVNLWHVIQAQPTTNEADAILQKMIEANNKVKTLKYVANIHERFNNNYIDKTSFFKVNLQPFKVYLSESLLGMKIEGLYSEGLYNNQMLICTKGFPWVNMTIDPRGNKARDNHHHTIFEAGFNCYIQILQSIKDKNHPNFSQLLTYEGITEIDKKLCHKITMEVPGYKIMPYIVKNGEDATIIANKFSINDYSILEINKLKNYKDLKAGQIIKIPNFYGKRFVFYLYKDFNLPALIEIYDDKGLYASYRYLELEINLHFTNIEFSKSNPGYHFE